MLVTSVFFSHNVFYPSKTNFKFSFTLFFCCLQVLSIWQSLKLLTTLTKRPFENIMGKGENGGKCWLAPFSPFPIIFSTHPKTFNLSSANAFNLDQSKNLSFGKETRAISAAISSISAKKTSHSVSVPSKLYETIINPFPNKPLFLHVGNF